MFAHESTPVYQHALEFAKWCEPVLERTPKQSAMHAQLVAAHAQRGQAARKLIESDLAVEQRLAKALVELADLGLDQPSADDVTLPFSQRELATFAGAPSTPPSRSSEPSKPAGSLPGPGRPGAFGTRWKGALGGG